MAAFFRFVSLLGVMSAGFYVLYLTQARLSDPVTMTQTVSEDGPQVKLGAAGEPPASSLPVTPGKPGVAEDSPSEATFPGETGDSEMFSVSSSAAATMVVEADPFSGSGIDFRKTNVVANEEPGLGIVTAAMAESDSTEVTLVSSENPFVEDAPRKPPETDSPAPFESSDPFESEDPFGSQPGESEKPTPKPETEGSEFDPFGTDVNEPEPFTTEKSADKKPAEEFPLLESRPAQPTPTDSGTGTEVPKKTPNPFLTEDPFSPFAEEPPEKTEEAKPPVGESPARKPELVTDPFEDGFPKFPAEKKPLAPNPEPASDPFSDPFPELEAASEKPAVREPLDLITAPTPTADPFGETPRAKPAPPATPDAFPDFPGEVPKPDKPLADAPASIPAKPLESGFDPFTEEPPALKKPESAEKPAPAPADADDFPAFEPLDKPVTETPAERNTTLPARDEFKDLDELLKRRVEEDERMRGTTPLAEPELDSPAETPRVLPELEEEQPESPPSDSTMPDELKSPPIGIVPSLSDLQGDGVLPPETPRQVQLPYLEIHKTAPPKAILNQPFVYTIVVKNVGEAAADDVTVQDQIPKGANLTGTIPQAELVGRRLVWELGRIEPGQEQKVAVRVVPIESGPIGSVATVNFVAEVGAETVVEHPEVAFRMTLPRQADVGEVVACRFEIENQGTKVVSGLVLRDIIPEGLHHPDGNDLENPLGDLKPGEKISEALELKVMKPGAHVNQAVLTAEGGLEIKQEAHLEATGNRLVISRRGPKERFVGRPAVFQNVVKNSSQETVRDAVIIETLPAGMQFVQAEQGGQYLATSREIYWKIAEIGPGQLVALDAQLTPVTPGVGESLVRVRESQGNEIQAVSHTQIRSYASIGLEVTEFDQPILVGDTVVMRVEATNRGNASAQTVQLRAKIPPTLQLMSVRGKTRFRVEGREVVFETLEALPAGKTEIIELELEAAAAAKAEVAISVQSQGMTQPLVKAAAVPIHSRQ